MFRNRERERERREEEEKKLKILKMIILTVYLVVDKFEIIELSSEVNGIQVMKSK